MKGETTVFSSNGKAWGDEILFEVVKRMYLKDNPDENVIFLKPEDDHRKAIRELKPKKFWFSEFYRGDRIDLTKYSGTIHYNVMNEIYAFAKRGIYPELTIIPEKPDVELPDKYVAMHIRNIEKVPERPNPKKNMRPELARNIIYFLYIEICNVVLIGDDNPIDLEREWIMNAFGTSETSKLFDLRKKLTLPEIAWVLKNAVLYVGRDSGMVHFAAACGTPMVVWNFGSDRWFPKMPEEKFTALQNKESTEEKILKEIGEKLNGKAPYIETSNREKSRRLVL